MSDLRQWESCEILRNIAKTEATGPDFRIFPQPIEAVSRDHQASFSTDLNRGATPPPVFKPNPLWMVFKTPGHPQLCEVADFAKLSP